MSDAGSMEEREEREEQYDEEHYVPRGPSLSSPMAGFPTHAQLKKVAEDEAPSTPCEPTGWWGSRDASRPWREKPELKRRASAPPEQVERWTRTKKVCYYTPY